MHQLNISAASLASGDGWSSMSGDVCMNEWNTVCWVSIDNQADDGDGNQRIKCRYESSTSV